MGAEHPGAPADWIAACARAGAGSPLLLRALLDDLGAVLPIAGAHHPSGEASTPTPYPPFPETSAALYPGSYPAAVHWWLDSAGPATAEVARVLAVLEEGWDGTTEEPAAPTPVGPVCSPRSPGPIRPGWRAGSRR